MTQEHGGRETHSQYKSFYGYLRGRSDTVFAPEIPILCVCVCVCVAEAGTRVCLCVLCMQRETTDRLGDTEGWSSSVQQVEIPFSLPLPLCLNSWSQSAFRTSFDVFFSTIFILLNQQAASTDDAVYLFIRTLIILPFYHTCDPLLHNQASDLTSKGVFILCGDSLAPGPAQLTTDTNMESPHSRPPMRAGPSPARACERCLVLVF